MPKRPESDLARDDENDRQAAAMEALVRETERLGLYDDERRGRSRE